MVPFDLNHLGIPSFWLWLRWFTCEDAYFRKTGLERSEGLSKDLEYFRQKGIVIPEPRNPGLTYTKYLEELAEKSAPLFLCHFYNIYFSHIAGGQVIGKQVTRVHFSTNHFDNHPIDNYLLLRCLHRCWMEWSWNFTDGTVMFRNSWKTFAKSSTCSERLVSREWLSKLFLSRDVYLFHFMLNTALV